MAPVLNSLILYAPDMQRTAAFYQTYFGFATTGEVVEGLIELTAPEGGTTLLVHQAAKENSARLGLEFGSTNQANGYAFANAKDPDGNSVCISSRAYRA
jgi:catechol 2,3-dioxygenase-like lactoylglutathione lyase family enzyme